MILIEVIQTITVVMGIAATVYPATWGYYFYSQRTGIGRALSHMLLGESFIMAFALWFSAKSLLLEPIYSGSYHEATVRNLSFIIALTTTIGLVRYFRMVQHKDDIVNE